MVHQLAPLASLITEVHPSSTSTSTRTFTHTSTSVFENAPPPPRQVQDTCNTSLERLASVEEAYRVTPSSLPNLPQDRDVEEEASQMVREVGAGRGAPSPVAQYHNGHLVNRVDIGGQQRWEGKQAG